jgi:diguanylate cyclase
MRELSRNALLAQIEAARAEDSGCSAVMLVRLCQQRDFRIDYGYEAAERADAAVSALIASVLRPKDRLARISEDSYALLLPQLASENHALLAANRLMRALRDELRVDGLSLSSDLAIGLTFCQGATESAAELLRHADIASAQAQRKGQLLERYAAGQMHSEIPMQELRQAIRENELEAWLQPVWDLRRGRIIGAESLARWNSPSRGWVSPALFVPLAEQSGLIGDFTHWSLNASLRHCAEARQRDPELHVAVNISPRIFIEDDVVERILAALRLWDVPADAVVLEVTEGAIMEDPHRSGQILERLHAAGLGISIDDFGTGYSSFAYLRQFPATQLKIDQSFVRSMRSETRSLQLVRSMIDLAHHLGIGVVAEGVEDEDLLRHVGELGCDFAQGYHIRRPQPAADFIASLAPAAV